MLGGPRGASFRFCERSRASWSGRLVGSLVGRGFSLAFVQRHTPEAIAVGNGTGGRETERLSDPQPFRLGRAPSLFRNPSP